ncbi:hypothetical protein AcW2_007157 [Taiwanofungus camphoratus]|nr:hypothetical protein AcW2_007157 [Antrodia cinnamomea]
MSRSSQVARSYLIWKITGRADADIENSRTTRVIDEERTAQEEGLESSADESSVAADVIQEHLRPGEDSYRILRLVNPIYGSDQFFLSDDNELLEHEVSDTGSIDEFGIFDRSSAR